MFNFIKSIKSAIASIFAVKSTKREVEQDTHDRVERLIELYNDCVSFARSAQQRGYANMLEEENFRIHKLAFMELYIELQDECIDPFYQKLAKDYTNLLETHTEIMAWYCAQR